MKKLVLIGGGENGRILEDGTKAPYDTREIDEEIVKLTNKKNPNFLFLGHAISSIEIQESYFQTMKKIYGDIFNCNCDILKSNELSDLELVKNKINWSDIIYEGGGDTYSMIKLWKNTHFDKILINAINDGKVISGISAGACCYFKSCNSDSLGDNFESIDCLNIFNAHFTPHLDELGRYESSKLQLRENNLVGIMLTNSSALEIIDDKYKFITSKSDNIEKPYGIKAYWINNEYYEEIIEEKDEFKKLEKLLSKE